MNKNYKELVQELTEVYLAGGMSEKEYLRGLKDLKNILEKVERTDPSERHPWLGKKKDLLLG